MIVILVGLAAGSQAGNSSATSKPSVAAVLSVQPAKAAFTVIEPPQVAVTLRNAGTKPIVLWTFEGDDLLGTYLLEFELVRLDGRQRVPVKSSLAW